MIIIDNITSIFGLAQARIWVRCIGALVSAFVLTLALGPVTIKWLRGLKAKQTVRKLGPKSHYKKSGTPTMGGLLMVFAIFVAVGVWGNITNFYLLLMLFVTFVFAAIGFVDDAAKVIFHSSDGLSFRAKIILQSIVCVFVSIVIYHVLIKHMGSYIFLPFLKDVTVNIGLWFFVVAYFVIVGTSNAVNLTDGLDGLAIGCVILVAAGFVVFAYICHHGFMARAVNIPNVPGTSEIALFCSAIVGAGLGFLPFNKNPAKVFMGDVGSLALGAALGMCAIIIRQEIIMFIMGGIFVIEALSVMLQVGSYKLRKKRIFKMAPIHHHFELSGWSEKKVVYVFWLVSLICVVIGLSSLLI